MQPEQVASAIAVACRAASRRGYNSGLVWGAGAVATVVIVGEMIRRDAAATQQRQRQQQQQQALAAQQYHRHSSRYLI